MTRPADLERTEELIDTAALPTGWTDEIRRRRAARRHPVIPVVLTTQEARLELARELAEYAWFLLKFHAVRIAWYVLKIVARAPVGAWRVTRAAADVVRDAEERPMMASAAAADDPERYLKLAKEHSARVRARAWVASGMAVAAAAAGWVATLLLPAWLCWLTLGALVAALGVHGRRRDSPIVSRPVDMPVAHVRVTSELIVDALRRLGVAALAKDAEIRFPAPIRDIGTGWLASIDLPPGVTPEMVVDKRPQLASGLRRPVGCVWPDADAEVHGGRLELTVLKVEMSKARQKPWPLRKNGAADVFDVLPFGTDQRGRPIGVPLIESNMLIGSLPGAGKTASLRVLLLGLALDPTVELHIWELKGSGDLESLERIAHAYGSGVDDDTIGRCLDGLRWLLAELGRRAAKLARLRQNARDLVPDSKVTRQLADRRDLGLYPITFVVDEAQELFSHEEHGPEAGQIATKLIKRGRALGVMLVLATQRPDKDSLPTGVSANVGTRFCLRVMGQVENDMVLGTSSYKNGLRATTFTRSDRGIGYLVGATDAPTVVRTYYLNAEASDAVIARAYAAREAAGLLTGAAAGDEPETSLVVSLLDDVRTVFATAERIWLWSEEATQLLGVLRPELYGDWTAELLGRNLRALGVEPRQLNRPGPDGVRRNQRGVELEQVEQALRAGGSPLVIEQGAT